MAVNLSDFSIRYPDFPKYIWDSATPYSDLMQVCAENIVARKYFICQISCLLNYECRCIPMSVKSK